MKRFVLMWLVLYAGCAVTEQVGQTLERPELISLVPLPPRRQMRIEQGLRLDVVMHITKEGVVDEASLRNTSGDAVWDSLAVEAIRKWRFSPARRNQAPVEIWIRQQVAVEFQEPVYMFLAELVCPTLEQADSMLALLREGADFMVLSQRSGGRLLLGEPGFTEGVDLATFPPSVSGELRKLREGDVSQPIRVGDKFIIYKRVTKQSLEPSVSLGMVIQG